MPISDIFYNWSFQNPSSSMPDFFRKSQRLKTFQNLYFMLTSGLFWQKNHVLVHNIKRAVNARSRARGSKSSNKWVGGDFSYNLIGANICQWRKSLSKCSKSHTSKESVNPLSLIYLPKGISYVLVKLCFLCNMNIKILVQSFTSGPQALSVTWVPLYVHVVLVSSNWIISLTFSEETIKNSK